MKKFSTNFNALVIKCQKTREQDLLVTLVTQENGKILVVAKGVRKLNSTKRAYLEPGNLVEVHLVETKGLTILTQAKLIADSNEARQKLASLRRFLLFLEILDRLLVNEELTPELFKKIVYLRELFLKKVTNTIIKKNFNEVLADLGFGLYQNNSSITNQVNEIIGSNLCAYDFLQLNS